MIALYHEAIFRYKSPNCEAKGLIKLAKCAEKTYKTNDDQVDSNDKI